LASSGLRWGRRPGSIGSPSPTTCPGSSSLPGRQSLRRSDLRTVPTRLDAKELELSHPGWRDQGGTPSSQGGTVGELSRDSSEVARAQVAADADTMRSTPGVNSKGTDDALLGRFVRPLRHARSSIPYARARGDDPGVRGAVGPPFRGLPSILGPDLPPTHARRVCQR